MIIRDTRARIRAQRDLDGTAWVERKRTRKRRLLRNMGKSLTLRGLNEKGVTVTWKDGRVAMTAQKHQQGFTQKFTASRGGEKKRGPDYSAPATAAQAKALIKAGYRRSMGKYKGGKKKGSARVQRVSQKWITENMSVGQAGYILRHLRGKEPAQSWTATVPARPMLGITETIAADMIKRISEETIERTRKVR